MFKYTVDTCLGDRGSRIFLGSHSSTGAVCALTSFLDSKAQYSEDGSKAARFLWFFDTASLDIQETRESFSRALINLFRPTVLFGEIPRDKITLLVLSFAVLLFTLFLTISLEWLKGIRATIDSPYGKKQAGEKRKRITAIHQIFSDPYRGSAQDPRLSDKHLSTRKPGWGGDRKDKNKTDK
jgi:hypothetical protein